MSGMMIRRSKIREISAAFVFVFLVIINSGALSAKAAELVDRTVQLSTSFPSATATHTFTFGTAGTSTIGSIMFEYCSNSPLHEDTCTAPAGLDTSGYAISSQSGITGFTNSAATTSSRIVITKSAASHPSTTTAYAFSNVINPSASQQPTYIRISVYDGQNATGTRVDRGSVVFVTDNGYDVSAYVPPYMTFCVGVTVALNCSSTQGVLVEFGELKENKTSTTTTQFSVATNDGEGYNAFISGQTMTSGNNVISALAASANSQIGTSQFGINLRSNSSPSVGSNMEGESVSSGSVDTNYNQANNFRFVSGERIASSVRSTGFNRYTVSYIVNVPSDQPPGVYATTLSYTAVASF